MHNFYCVTKDFFKNCFIFEGRCSRAEFWWPVLVVVLPINIAVIVVGRLIEDFSALYSLFHILQLTLLIPVLSAVVRRLHDLDISGWWFLSGFVIAIMSAAAALGGMLWLEEKRFVYFLYGFLFFPVVLIPALCFKGTAGFNRFDRSNRKS